MLKTALFRINGVLVILLSLISVSIRAQSPGNLILIDAEAKQPFTVRIGDQLFASSGHGHLVITHLQDSNYKLSIRFQKLNSGDLVFPVTVRGKDLGFQIKRSDSSWILYNWQTKESVKSMKVIDSSRVLVRGVKRDDGFSSLMAAVVNDSTVMYNTYEGTGLSGRDTINVVKSDSSRTQKIITNTNPNAIIVTQKKAPDAELPKTAEPIPVAGGVKVSQENNRPAKQSQKAGLYVTGIKKIRESSLKISRKITYVDITKDGSADTVILFIYFENSKADSVVKTIRVANSQPATASGQPPKANRQLSDANNHQQCLQVASESDLGALRTAVLEANSEQEKIAVASGAFALKCFTVAQIRVLAGLFVSEKTRYKLMDAAHLHVSDHEQFHTMVDMFVDKIMQKKFLLLAGKQS
jgi:Domain of unknown function (DUF4476)